MESLVKRELEEIKEFASCLDSSVTVIRDEREIEIISRDTEAFHERMRERFGTTHDATICVTGEGNITELYDVPDENKDLSAIKIEVRDTRSELELNPTGKSSGEVRPMSKKEIQEIDEWFRASDIGTNGLTKKLYEDLQRLQVPDAEY